MIELTLPDISCGHCAKTVTQAVLALDPAAQVQVDLASKRVQIASALPREQLEAALREEGYPAASTDS
ncbi:MAG TPA: heavy-metal-associated domain-containing protein [Ideonella sp.]|nr:heavy-metal-associated domain-containing protein [Ideonella sp.]